jgi:hypothetical protein
VNDVSALKKAFTFLLAIDSQIDRLSLAVMRDNSWCGRGGRK